MRINILAVLRHKYYFLRKTDEKRLRFQKRELSF